MDYWKSEKGINLIKKTPNRLLQEHSQASMNDWIKNHLAKCIWNLPNERKRGTMKWEGENVCKLKCNWIESNNLGICHVQSCHICVKCRNCPCPAGSGRVGDCGWEEDVRGRRGTTLAASPHTHTKHCA